MAAIDEIADMFISDPAIVLGPSFLSYTAAKIREEARRPLKLICDCEHCIAMFCQSGKVINTIGQELDRADIFPSCLGGQRQRKGRE